MGGTELAGLPFVTTADIAGGASAWVVDRNGSVCTPTAGALATAIWHVQDRADSYEPRGWALENMCLPVALGRLREAMGAVAER